MIKGKKFLILELFQDIKELLIFRLLGNVVYIDVLDDPILVDYKDRPLGDSTFSQDTELQSDMALRIKIAEKGIRKAPQRPHPGFIRWDIVSAHAQDLGIVPFKLGDLLLVRRHLTGSDRGEGRGVKYKDDILVSTVILERHLFPAGGRESKVRRLFSYSKSLNGSHAFSFLLVFST